MSLEALPSPLSFSQRARDPQLVERRPLKRGAQSLALRIIEAAVEEPQSKKPKKDKGKAIMTEKELCSDPLRFTKRRIVNPLVIGEEFWLQHLSEDDNIRYGQGIQQFQSLLQLQGWDKLITKPFVVNDDVVRLFYAGMSFVSSKENSPASDIIFNWEDKLIPLNAKLISSMLEIESKKGFNILVTTRSWPKGKDFRPKKETIKEIFGDLILGDLDTSLLPLDRKLLHIFLTSNVIPREDYKSTVLLNDVVLMEKLISGSLVDLSRIMLAHMQYCFNHESHALPYPHLVKKILKFFDYYPEDIPETSYTSCLTLDIIRSLKFRTDEQPSQPPLLEAPPIAPSLSSAPPPPVGIDPAIITDGFKGLETTIFESAQYLGNIITKFGMHHAETVANIEAMVKTLYTCHSSFLEAFE